MSLSFYKHDLGICVMLIKLNVTTLHHLHNIYAKISTVTLKIKSKKCKISTEIQLRSPVANK